MWRSVKRIPTRQSGHEDHDRGIVLDWYVPAVGASATSSGHRPARAAPSSSAASATKALVPISTVTRGWALRLWYQAGWVGEPPFEAMMAMPPSGRDEQANGVTRSIPDRAPMRCRRSIGVPVSEPPTRPAFARNSSMTLALRSFTWPNRR